MLSLVLSTVAFFIAAYFINRYLDSIDAPKGMTRNLLKFSAALMIAYGVAFGIDRLMS